MAGQTTYQLQTNISLEDLTKLINDLYSNPRRLPTGDLEIENNPSPGANYLDVVYDDDKANAFGNVSHRVLHNILIEIQNELDKFSEDIPEITLPTVEGTKEKDYEIFYFYSPYNSSSQSVNKAIIGVFQKIISNKLEEDKKEDEITQFNSISRLKRDLSSGDFTKLKGNWSKSSGVRTLAQGLLNLKVGDKSISGQGFGPQYTKDNYSFADAISALNAYHKAFKEALIKKNFQYLADSEEGSALKIIEDSGDEFFSGRNFSEEFLVSNEKLKGKLSSEHSELAQFIKTYNKVIEVLKKPAPSAVGGSDSDADEDGGTDEEPEEEDTRAKISVKELHDRVKAELTLYIYDSYYKVKEDDDTSKATYLNEIESQILPEIDLESIIDNKLKSFWISKVVDGGVIDDEGLTSLINHLITVELKDTVSSIIENLDKTDEKIDVSPNFDDQTVSDNTFDLLKENTSFKNSFTKETWDNLDSKGKEKQFLTFYDHWKTLSISDRRKLLSQLGDLKTDAQIQLEISQAQTLEEAALIANSQIGDIDQALEEYSDEFLQIIANELNLSDIKLEGLDESNSRKLLKESLRDYLGNNPQALHLFFQEAKSSRFINKYGYQFIKERQSSFTPIIDRFHFAHRIVIKDRLLARIAPEAQRALEDNLHLILAQAAIDGVNPSDYIRSLSIDELQGFFNIDTKDLDKDDLENLRSLLIKYMEASIKAGHLEESLKSDGEFDQQRKSEFLDDFTFLQSQSKKAGGGRIVYRAITEETIEDPEEREKYLDSLNNEARREYNKIEAFKKAFWASYSIEQQALLQELAQQNNQIAQNQAIHDWERTLRQQGQTSIPPRTRGEKRNSITKGLEDAAITGVDTAAMALGQAWVQFLPPEAKLIIASVAIGLAALLAAGIAGLASLAFKSLTGGFGSAVSGFGSGAAGSFARTSARSFGRSSANLGTGKAGSSLGKSSLTKAQSSAAQIAKGAFTSTAAVAITATAGLGLWGSLVATESLHTAFLMRVPEVDPDVGDSSKYAILEKTALEGNEFDSPREITYSLSITPREGYEIQITAPPSDNFSFTCNEETRSDGCPSNTNGPEFSDYNNFISRMIEVSGTTLRDGETLDLGTYTVPFNDNYRDASVENDLTVTFSVVSEGEIIVEEEVAKTSETICFGECPKLKEGCWPTSGIIKQVPYTQFYDNGEPASHSNNDAVDIANTSAPKVFSTSAGEACFYQDNTGSGISIKIKDSSGKSISVFGNHVLVKSGSYALLYAHLETLEESDGVCINVEAGDFLGYMGTTGNSTGTHLHWEMKVLGGGFGGYTSRISGQNFNMTGQTLLEQHAPISEKMVLNYPPETCYE